MLENTMIRSEFSDKGDGSMANEEKNDGKIRPVRSSPMTGSQPRSEKDAKTPNSKKPGVHSDSAPIGGA